MARPTTETLGSPAPAVSRGLVLAAGRAPEIVAFHEQTVEFFADAAEMLRLMPEYHSHLDPS